MTGHTEKHNRGQAHGSVTTLHPNPSTRHPLSPGTTSVATGLWSGPAALGPAPRHPGPHLRLCLGVPGLGLLQHFFKGGFPVSLRGPCKREKNVSEPACGQGPGGQQERPGWSTSVQTRPGGERRPHDAPQGGGRTPPAVSSGSAVSGRLGRAGPQSRVPPPPWAPCLAAVLGGPPQFRACTRGPASVPHRPKARLLRLQSVQPQSVGVHSEKRLYHRVTTHPSSSCGGIYIPGARKARWGGSQAARGFPVPSLYRGSCTTRCGIVGAVLPADHQPRHPTERLPL